MVLPNTNYSYQSLVDLLEYRAQKSPDIIAYRYLLDDFGNSNTITYKMLATQAQAIAATLQQQGALSGERAILIYPPGIDLIAAFFGCLYAGIIAIPLYPPIDKVTTEKFQRIIKDSEPVFLLTTTEDIEKYRQISVFKKIFNSKFVKGITRRYFSKRFLLAECNLESFAWITTNNIPLNLAGHWKQLTIPLDHLAFLQYTSGSTDFPKGVMVSHGNLLDNLELMHQSFYCTPGSIMVYWLPPYHDMGLIAGILISMYKGNPSVFFSPAHFVRNPYAWLKAVSDYHAELSLAPSFAYDYCVKKITNEQLSTLNLTNWKHAIISAEPVYAETLSLFYNKFKQCGFQIETFRSCYGLAEATVFVSGYKIVKSPTILKISKNELQHHRIKFTEDESDVYRVVSCGNPRLEVKIINPKTSELCDDASIGEVWVHGFSVASGYWRRVEESNATFNCRILNDVSGKAYLRTGDYGFIYNDEVYITGRLKDLIIIHGVNHYPQDIELTVGKSDSSIRKGCCAAFSVNINSQEKLVIITELKKQTRLSKSSYQKICQAIAKNVILNHEIAVHAIMLIASNTIPKTTSGKIRRKYSKFLFENNQWKPLFNWTSSDESIVSLKNKQLIIDEGKDDILELLVNDVILIFSRILKIDKSSISATQNLSAFELDSLAVIEFTEAIADIYAIQLTPPTLFEHSSILSFSKYLLLTYSTSIHEYYTKKKQGQLTKVSIKNSPHTISDDIKIINNDIAIIGMSGIFPGADNLVEFWMNLENGKNCISEIPLERWDWREYQGDKKNDNKTNVKWGGFINGIDQFDAAFFQITPREAALMDPQQRLFLKVVWQAMEDAGYTREKLAEFETGVYVGVSSNDYLELLQKNNEMSAHTTTGNSHSVLANRVSYFLDLHGPSEIIDTACSSSLVAVHHAVQAIRSGDCQIAIVGGVNTILTPTLHIAFDKAGMLSADGACKTFDKSANGYVRGEGAGAIILKSLGKAFQDSDTIYGVIKGSAVNHGGHVNALTIPNPRAQAEVIKKAILESKVDIQSISYIETHGTGTSLGDPIEINGLKKAFDSLSDGKNTDSYCGLGALKSNIGHLEAAAGIAGVIKVLLALHHKKLPGNLHFQELNPYIELTNSPFYILDKTKQWPNHKDKNGKDIPHRAGISSFGFGGTNAHIIIEEFISDNKRRLSIPTHVFDKTRHWYNFNKNTALISQHKSIFSQNENNSQNQTNEVIFIKEFPKEIFFLKDHIVGTESILPAVVYLEMIYSAANITYHTFDFEVFDIVWLVPIIVKEASIKIYLSLKSDKSESKFEIYTMNEHRAIVHCRGQLRDEYKKINDEIVDIDSIRKRCVLHKSKNEIYEVFNKIGLHYGSSFQAMQQLETNAVEALAEVQLSPDLVGTLNNYILHPSLLDAALGVTLGFYLSHNNLPLLIPFALESIVILSQPIDKFYSHAVLSKEDLIGKFDIKIFNEVGQIHIIIKGFINKEYKKPVLHKEIFLYKPVWRQQEFQAIDSHFDLSSTLIFYNDQKIRDLLQGTPQKIIWVKQGETFKLTSDFDYEINPNIKNDYQSLFQDLSKNNINISYVLNTLCLQNSTSDDIFTQQLYILQFLTNTMRNKPIKYLFVYQNQLPHHLPVYEAISGFFNSVKSLNSSLSIVSLGFDETTYNSSNAIDYILKELITKETHSIDVRYKNSVRSCRYLEEINNTELADLNSKAKIIKSNKTYLITGGNGALGKIFAEYLADNYQGNLILVGRRAIDSDIESYINKLAAKGCHCIYLATDTSDLADVKVMLEQIKSRFGSLNGIIHSAGIADETPFTEVTQQDFSNVLAPKIQGTINLDLVTQNEPLDFFILFSSISSELGDFGAGSYAAANRFMDGYVQLRDQLVSEEKRKGRSISINWPYWENGGIKIPDKLAPLYFDYSGLKSITNDIGIEAFEKILSLPYIQVAVGYGDKSKIEKALKIQSKTSHVVKGEKPLLDKSDLNKTLMNYLKGLLSEVSGLALNTINSQRAFEEYGIDSIMLVDFNNKLNQSIPNINKQILFEHKTLHSLARALESNYMAELQNVLNINLKELDVAEDVSAMSSISASDKPITTLLSLNQERLWFIYRYNPDDTTYNVGMAIHFDGNLIEDDLWKSIQEVVRRHEAFRMVFSEHDGKPIAIVQPSPILNQRTVDFYDLNKEKFLKISKIEFNKEIQTPTYLDKGPILRHTLLRSHNTYTLIICSHHIVFDGWSFFLYVKELADYYNASHRKLTYPNTVSELKFVDYIQEQRERVKGQLLSDTLNFWKSQLSNIMPVKFPTDFPHSGFKPQMEVHEFLLPHNLEAHLTEFSQKNGLTIFTVLFAAYCSLIYRYTNIQSFTIGVPLYGREKGSFKDVIGFFVNTLPVPVHISATTTAKDLLKQIKDFMQTAFKYQEVPLSQLLTDNYMSRDNLQVGHLFQTMFELVNFQIPEIKFDDLHYSIASYENSRVPCDIALDIFSHSTQIKGILVYNSLLFKSETIERISEHWIQLLKSLISNELKPISQLPMLSDEELKLLLVKFNQTEYPYPSTKSIHQLFEYQANIKPDNLAITHAGKHLSYRELNDKANQLAHYLVESGIKIYSTIAICLEPSPDVLIALLGIMKAGCAYLPIDVNYPVERIEFILNDSAVSVLIMGKSLKDKLSIYKGKCILYSDLSKNVLQKYPKTNLEIEISENDIAYIIYTSGSTGKPKGTLLQNKGLLNSVNWYHSVLHVNAEDISAQLSSISFDAFGCEVWPFLTTGASVCIGDGLSKYTAEQLIDWLKLNKISFCYLPTQVWEMVSEYDSLYNASLRVITIGGEKVTHFPSREFSFELWNTYGPTETTIECIAYRIDKTAQQSDLICPPIGKPIHNFKVYILDSANQPVPIGVPGELYVSGVGVGLGYLNNSTLTSQRFLQSPFSNTETLYKTGDVCRWLSDGNIEYIDRLDNQIKLRGFRVELGEIESRLEQHPAIKSAVVVTPNKTYPITRMDAYWIPIDSKNIPSVSDLREFLKHYLPDYMLPNYFIQLNNFPLTHNGKVDRNALAAYDNSHINTLDTYKKTETELQLARIWSSVLNKNVEHINVTDNFFMLGGHSLSILELLSKINNQFKKNISVQAIFKFQTIKEQAIYLLNNQIDAPDLPSNIIKLNASTSSRLLFCLHPVGGNVLCYSKLAEVIDNRFSIYGIQSIISDSDQFSFDSIESLSKLYLSQIKAIQPNGPYALLGWSTGGLIGFEIARQARLAGDNIALLMLIDTYDPAYLPKITELNVDQIFTYLLKIMLSNSALSTKIPHSRMLCLNIILKFGLSSWLSKLIINTFNAKNDKLEVEFIKNVIKLLQQDLSQPESSKLPVSDWIAKLKNKGFLQTNIEDKQLKNLYETFRENFIMSEHYSPDFFDGKLTYIDTNSQQFKHAWHTHCQSLEIIKVPGDHYNILNNIASLKIISNRISETLSHKISVINKTDDVFLK